MPEVKHKPILDRGEGNHRRRERLAKIKKGPGTFIYDGEMCVSIWEPTVMLVGRDVAVFNADSMPAMDASGRQIFEKAGSPMRDDKGRPVLGGPPKKTKKKLTTFVVWGVSFPAGEPVEVTDPTLALKLRCLGGFTEIEPGEADPEDIAPKKRGRKPNGTVTAEA
jgi:hypothetical protein